MKNENFQHTFSLQEARGVYLYFLAKISELLDTVFFVLRKKDRQLSFLHMYHHTVMPMISWGATKYYPGGHGTFIGKRTRYSLKPKILFTKIKTLFFSLAGTINSFVHIIMYSYYLLAAMGPRVQKYLWWKKHITNLQMVSIPIAPRHPSTQQIHLFNNSFLNFLFRFNSVWHSFIRPNCCGRNAVIHAGRLASRCPMPFSSTFCSTISIKNLTNHRITMERWKVNVPKLQPALPATTATTTTRTTMLSANLKIATKN